MVNINWPSLQSKNDGGELGLNKGWRAVIGDIYQMLHNQDMSVCTQRSCLDTKL